MHQRHVEALSAEPECDHQTGFAGGGIAPTLARMLPGQHPAISVSAGLTSVAEHLREEAVMGHFSGVSLGPPGAEITRRGRGPFLSFRASR